ncbi:Protein phosphatase 2C [Micromonospora echinofusca]|uniref:Protein phosphatase 2C n=1 Tax=Micromonospora echinofusca TaxID=47858 RepID=A0A1C5G3X4_MICEH|nr:protein phosphatase 2C domain-containing protein [Micromonospora echinofusca]SCG14585.1 Protein phosphatase 2C [Micromonospora echinofusca]
MRPKSPRLATIRTAQRRGPDRPSEDRIFTTDNAAVVLDGASQPDASDRDGGWLADTLGREIAERLHQSGDDLDQLLTDAITSVMKRHDLRAGAAPSTTVSIARWDSDSIDILVLGDSPVIALTHDGELRQVRDDRLRQVARYQRQQLNRAGPGFGFDDADQWRNLTNAERTQRNQPGGYWIAEATPEAAAHAMRDRWDIQDLTAILMMTDGVSAGVDRYGQPAEWRTAVDMALADPALLVDLVHDTEAEDPNGNQWPRSKRHDDKALAVIEFNRR